MACVTQCSFQQSSKSALGSYVSHLLAMPGKFSMTKHRIRLLNCLRFHRKSVTTEHDIVVGGSAKLQSKFEARTVSVSGTTLLDRNNIADKKSKSTNKTKTSK